MSQTIVGGSVIKPVFEWAAIRWLNLALLGEINGRFIDIRGKHGQSAPSIETLYTDATAPGLTNQPGFIQLGEGLRIKPAIGNLQLNYLGKFQQFFAPSDSQNSFLRWTVDLNHTYYLYGYARSGTKGHGDGRPRFLRAGRRNVPRDFAYTKSERLDRSALAAFRVDQFGDERGALLFSADPRRIGHQQRVDARQLSGLSVSRTQCSAFAGEL